MVKIRPLITLVVGKQKEVAPGTVCDVSEDEAKRLVELNFAERVTKEENLQGKDNDKSNANGGGQPVPLTGEDSNV